MNGRKWCGFFEESATEIDQDSGSTLHVHYLNLSVGLGSVGHRANKPENCSSNAIIVLGKQKWVIKALCACCWWAGVNLICTFQIGLMTIKIVISVGIGLSVAIKIKRLISLA